MATTDLTLLVRSSISADNGVTWSTTDAGTLVVEITGTDVPPPVVTPPPVLDQHPANVKAVASAAAGDNQIVLTWTDPLAGAPASYAFGRDGTDTVASGVYTATGAATVHSVTFDKLLPATVYNLTVTAVWGASSSTSVVVQATTPAGTVVTPPPVTTSGSVTWSSGAYTAHDPNLLVAMGTWRGNPMDNGNVFVSRGSNSAITNSIAGCIAAVPKSVPEIVIALPMCNTSLSDDMTAPFTAVANALKADGRPTWIRLGWEMNLPQWIWHVSDANLQQWRNRWSQYYDLFRSIMGVQARIGFNPNTGANQSGLTGSILQAWVDGKVDWCGPDLYDEWPSFLSAAGIAQQHTEAQGIDFWVATAKAKGVPLCFPEWGVSSGTQWAGHDGNDDPGYIREVLGNVMLKNASIMGYDSYFNEPAGYVDSAIYPTTFNPNSGAAYKALMSA